MSKLYKQIASTYADLQGGEQYDEEFRAEVQELEKSFRLLLKFVSRLNPDQEKDGKDYAAQVYLYVFTTLVDALQQAAKFYAVVSELPGSQHPRSVGLTDLESLIMIGNIIQTLDSHSRDWKTKSDSKQSIVGPIRREVLSPLKKMLYPWKLQVNSLR